MSPHYYRGLKLKYSVKHLLIEPYRLFFFVGSTMAILMQGHWFAHLVRKAHGTLNPALVRPTYQVHGHEMYYLIFAYFAFGFLLTAYPRFVDAPHPKPWQVLGWVACLFFSEILLWFGLRNPILFYLSSGLELIVYVTVLLFLLRSFLKSKATWRDQPRLILIALIFGIIGSTLGNLALIHPGWAGLRGLSVQFGLYGFIMLLIFAITWRVVPFFSSRVIPGYTMKRGQHSGKIVLGLISIRLLLGILTVKTPAFYATLLLFSWIVDTLFLATFLYEIKNWRHWLAKVFPPLFILYVGLAWVVVFLAISPLQIIGRFFSPSLETFLLMHDKNLLHIFNLGAFGTLILAIASRVTRGHGGLPLRFDALALLSLILMQVAMAVRVFDFHNTMHYASLLWIAAFSLWAWRHLPILLQLPKGAET